MNRAALERHLRAHGCRFLRHGGRHDIWINPTTQDEAALPRHREVKTVTARDVCRQLQAPTPAGR